MTRPCRRTPQKHHAPARFKTPRPARHHDPATLDPRNRRQCSLHAVCALDQIQIRRVNRCRLDAHQHLTRRRFARFKFLHAEHLFRFSALRKKQTPCPQISYVMFHASHDERSEISSQAPRPSTRPQQIIQGALEVRMAKMKSKRLQHRRPNLLTRQQHTTKSAQHQLQRKGRHRQHCRTPQALRKLSREVRIALAHRCHRIDRARHPLILHRLNNRAAQIMNMNPRHPLPAMTKLATKTSLHHAHQFLKRRSTTAHHHADAQAHNPHAQGLSLHRRLLPLAAKIHQIPLPHRRSLIEFFLTTIPINPHRRGIHQHLRPLVRRQISHELHHPPRHTNPAFMKFFPIRRRPSPIDRLTRQIYHRLAPCKIHRRHRLPPLHARHLASA